VQGEVEYFIN